MNTPHKQVLTLPRWLLGVIAAVVLCSSNAMAPTATAATGTSPTAPPGLSITISDGVTETTSGSSLTYTATVTNRGPEPVAGDLVITLPSSATYSHAKGAQVTKADATWKVKIQAGKLERRHATANVGKIPIGAVRVTTLATLYAPGERSTVLIRAADANTIHGVLDPAHTVGQSPKTANTPDNPPFLIVNVTTLAMLLALTATAILLLRRRKRQAPSGDSRHISGKGHPPGRSQLIQEGPAEHDRRHPTTGGP